MSDVARDGLPLDDEDRLPWLEPADDAEESDGVSPLKLLGFVLGALALLGVIIGGVWFVRGLHRDAGESELIAAPKENYKIPASEADAKKFAGEGDASYATSEGIERGGRIDPARLPEAPLAAAPKASVKSSTNADAVAPQSAAGTAKPSAQLTAKVADETKAMTRPATSSGSAAKGGALVQLGAYGSAAIAKDAWAKLSKRFDYLAGLSSSVEPVTLGGTTLYRLRASGAPNASALCGRLKVAGENCMVVN